MYHLVNKGEEVLQHGHIRIQECDIETYEQNFSDPSLLGQLYPIEDLTSKRRTLTTVADPIINPIVY